MRTVCNTRRCLQFFKRLGTRLVCAVHIWCAICMRNTYNIVVHMPLAVVMNWTYFASCIAKTATQLGTHSGSWHSGSWNSETNSEASNTMKQTHAVFGGYGSEPFSYSCVLLSIWSVWPILFHHWPCKAMQSCIRLLYELLPTACELNCCENHHACMFLNLWFTKTCS